jgi:methyl-accepting chemotaxis protein
LKPPEQDRKDAGFAVVASEVRNLAQRSANAAKEIKSLINTSSEAVQHGNNMIDSAGKTMRKSPKISPK